VQLKYIPKFFLILMYFLAMPVWASGVFISEINGKPEDFKIWRNNQPLKHFQQYTQLQVGDKVCVHKRDKDPNNGQFEGRPYFMMLSVDGQPKKITQKVCCYTVESSEPPPTLVTGVLDRVSEWFRTLWNDDVTTRKINTKSDNAESQHKLSIPLLEGEIKLRAALRKQLNIAWYGGKSPYTVTVSSNEQQLFELSTNLNTREIVLPNFTLVAKQDYTVKITDANQQIATETFSVVDSLPPEISSNEELKAIRQNFPNQKVLLLSWLANQGQGEWRLEAYQCVARATREKNSSEFLLKQGLRRGL
jgi:hypothetical protein